MPTKRIKKFLRDSRNFLGKKMSSVGESIVSPEPPPKKTLSASFVRVGGDPRASSDVEDLLYPHFIEKFRQLIISLREPFVLSIAGSWGRGKTFAVEHALDSEFISSDCAVARIDAWSIPQNEPAMPYVLAAIAKQLNARPDATSALIKVGSAVAWLGMASAPTNPLSLGVVAMGKLLEWAADEALRHEKQIENLRTAFKSLVESRLKILEKSRLIVFIDNLDRCSPEQCLSFLDQLGQFLKNSKAIFILALDEKIVENALHNRYGKDSSISASGYLEKIVDLSLGLPSPNTTNVLALLTARFNDGITSADLRADMANAIRSLAAGNPLVAAEVARNPRKLFRVVKGISVFFHFEGTARLGEIQPLIPGILIMSIIRVHRPKFFDALCSYPNLLPDFVRLKATDSEVSFGHLRLGSISSGDLNARLNTIKSRVNDLSFFEDADSLALSKALLADIGARHEDYRKKWGEQVTGISSGLTEIVSRMSF